MSGLLIMTGIIGALVWFVSRLLPERKGWRGDSPDGSVGGDGGGFAATDSGYGDGGDCDGSDAGGGNGSGGD